MRQDKLLIPTLRENPADAEIKSHQYMVRAGLIRQLFSGVYSYLPLGLRVLQKIEQIVREEMNRAGAQELLLPIIQPAELWHQTGRWDDYGPELIRLQDRHERDVVLGPTHEEVITSLVRDNLTSYKRFPINLYQIQTKFRDEIRPRFGVMRSREFVMKDAYSFDMNEEGLDQTYQAMYEAYSRIFQRCGLNFRPVEADSGAIGGTDTHEFMVLSEVGEDTIAYCDSCHYAANIEKAEVRVEAIEMDRVAGTYEKVHTPNQRTIDEVAHFLQVEPQATIKALLYLADEEPVLVLVRGDYEVNEIKVKKFLGVSQFVLADEQEVEKLAGVEFGFLGPVDSPFKVIADHSVAAMAEGICGANEKDYHLQHVQPEIHFQVAAYGDLRNLEVGDHCPRCEQGRIQFARGIEVGHIFKLGTKYSETLGAHFVDEAGKSNPLIMGCYGIGISRTLAAVVEQHADDAGIAWPLALAPFQVHVVPVQMKNEEQRQAAESIYQELQDAGYEVLLDDRNERAGVKFADADLIGAPLRITVGKRIGEGIVEVKVRQSGEMEEVQRDQLLTHVQRKLQALSH